MRAEIVLALAVAEAGIEQGTLEAAADPAIAGAPPAALARALWRIALPGIPPRISARRQAQLEAAARRIDRCGQPGDWVRYAGRVLAGWAAGAPAQWVSEAPRSLGALAVELKREANMRRTWRVMHSGRVRPTRELQRRAQVKRWRADQRAQGYPMLRKPWRG